MEELHYPSYGRKYNQSNWYLDTFIPVLAIMGIAYFIFGTQPGNVLQPVWILVVMMTMIKVVPGAGGNSTPGVVMVAIIILIAIMTIPDVYRELLDTTIRVIRPLRQDIPPDPTSHLLSKVTFLNPGWIQLGYAPTNFFDAIRKVVGYAPMLWVMLDDLLGPGAAINEAATFHIRSLGTQDKGIAAMYNGSWWSILLLEMFLCYWTGNVYTAILLTLSTAFTWFIWNKVGRREWIGRGKGVNLVNVRAGYAMVFGQGPEGLRLFILRICTLLAWMCLVMTHEGNLTSLGLLFAVFTMTSERATSLMLGIATLSPILVLKAWKERLPLTGSIAANKVDAFTPGGGVNDT